MKYRKRNILTIDVGNSFDKIAVYDNDELIHFSKIDHLKVDDIKRINEEYNIEGIAYSASGDDDEEVLKYIVDTKNHVFLTWDTPMPINILYKTPKTLGRDRIAATLGAYSLFPKENVLIVDLGTCITFELLDKKGNYLGGNISPGVQMRLDAMHHFTARLPLVEIEGDDFWIGRSTESALRNGAVLGTQLEIESFIGQATNLFGDFRIIFTGGGAKYIKKRIKNNTIIEVPHLIQRGLYEILKYNEGK